MDIDSIPEENQKYKMMNGNVRTEKYNIRQDKSYI